MAASASAEAAALKEKYEAASAKIAAQKEEYEAAALIQSQRRAALARERVETLKAERAQRDEKERVAEEARIKAAKELQKSGPQPPKCIFGHIMELRKVVDKQLRCNVCCEMQPRQSSAIEYWWCTSCSTTAGRKWRRLIVRES